MVAAMLRNNKRILICLNVVLAAMVAGCVFYALLPVDVTSKKSPPVTVKKLQNKQPEKPQRVSRKNYDAIRIMPLRRPLVDVEKKPEIVTAPIEHVSNLNVQLLGTVVESDHMYGLFRCGDGKDKLAGPGKKIDNAEVITITEKSATLKFNGQLVELKVVKQVLAPLPPGIPSIPGLPENPGNIRQRVSRRRASVIREPRQ